MSLSDLLNSGQPLLGLSPMDGVTDEPLRLMQAQIAKPDLIFTEFVNAEGISRGGIKLYDQLLYSQVERPIVGQLFGKDPESFYKAAVILCELGFDGIDINMGCPAKTVTQHGSGAALIAKPGLAGQIIISAREGINDWISNKISITDIGLNQKSLDVIKRNQLYSGLKISQKIKPTLSVKTRLGITEVVIDSWIPFLLTHHLDFLTLHGRTLKQAYSGFADWNLISEAAKITHQTKTKFFGNGDVNSRKLALEYIQKYNVDGVLIGRSSLGNPWIFTDKQASLPEKFETMLFHVQLFNQIFPRRRFEPLRRYFLAYANGLPNAKKLRSKLVSVTTLDDLCALEGEFLNC